MLPANRNIASVDEIAKHYGVCKATIWRWVKAGQFPKPIKLGIGLTRWNISEVMAWEDANGQR